ncbi:MAG TPA: phage holin family protein [Polyangia bacterium]|nr:phage holin family protein [Polyangia bacterium]
MTLPGTHGPSPSLDSLSTPALLAALPKRVETLVKAQITLLKAEVRADLSKELGVAEGLGVAAVCGLAALNLLLVTAVLALSTIMRGWLAGLAVTGLVLVVAAIAGGLGWRGRVRKPLARTRHELEEDVKWTKERPHGQR